MKKTTLVITALAAILLPLAAAAAIHVVEFPVTKTGHITREGWVDNIQGIDPIFWMHSDSTPNWGMDRERVPGWSDWYNKEWRAYLGFDFGNWLRPGNTVTAAQFYYGGRMFVSGGPDLPEYFEAMIFDGNCDPNNLNENDWHDGEYAGPLPFGQHPGPKWVSLNKGFVERLNDTRGTAIIIRDNSHVSVEGFYGAIAERCILKLRIDTGPDTPYHFHDVKAMSNDDMTFGQVKSLYR